MKNKLFLFLALSVSIGTQAMEEKQVDSPLSTLPEELKLLIVSRIEGKNFTETIKELLNLRPVSKEWSNITRDEQLIRFIVQKYKERDENNQLSYYAIFSKAHQAVLNEKSGDQNFAELVALHEHGTFYSEFVQAAQRRKIVLVKLILAHDPNLSKRENLTLDSQTALNQALYAATVNNDQEMVKLLISHGAQAKLENIYGNSPIKVSTEKDFIEIFRLLWQANAQDGQEEFNVHVNGKLLSTALMSNHTNIAEVIIDESSNIDLEIANPSGYDMLQIAIRDNNIALVEKLLHKGAHVDQADIDMSDRKRKRTDGETKKRGKKIAKLLTRNLDRVFVTHADNQTDMQYDIAVVDSNGDVISSGVLAAETKTTLNLNLTVNNAETYPTVIITGHGLPAEGWRYTPTGQTRLLSFCVREFNGIVVVEKKLAFMR